MPVEATQKSISPLLVSVDDDLGVGTRMELMAVGLELDTQLLKVVQLTVVAEEHVAGLIGHRLVAGWREVDYRQAAVDQPDRPGRPHPFAIRAPMSDGCAHRLQRRSCHWLTIEAKDAGYSTHQLLTFSSPAPLSHCLPHGGARSRGRPQRTNFGPRLPIGDGRTGGDTSRS